LPSQSGLSFRIVHPAPGAYRSHVPSDPILHCVVEVFGKPSSILRRSLRMFPRDGGRGGIRGHHFSASPRTLRALAMLPGLDQDLSQQIISGIEGHTRDLSWDLGGGLRWGRKTLVMGILNITPDSFSDGGRFLDTHAAVDQALRMQEEGADWIDVGGESSRPGAAPVTLAEEKRRVLPVMKACAKRLKVPLSVDTYKAEMARAAVGEGARMVNDIGALDLDPKMGSTLARLKVPVLMMHMKGRPRTMQVKPRYRDLMGDLLFFFRQRVGMAEQWGISRDRLVLDPGFGFGKTPAHNLELTDRLWELKALGRPLVLGPSRKSTLGHLLGGVPVEGRLEATLAAVTVAVLRGAACVRVHDVKETVKAVKIADAIRYGRGGEP